MGVAVWPMVELEADDALASAAAIAARDKRVEKVCIWSPDKDLAQCVRGERVVQMDRRKETMRDEAGVKEAFGVEPARIPDYLALVGDSADGYPGIQGIGAVGAARLIARHGPIESFPPEALGAVDRKWALLFKDLATLRVDAPLFRDVDELLWAGPGKEFSAMAATMGADRLVERARKAASDAAPPAPRGAPRPRARRPARGR
jgi:5'-3' exonuclease